jgi:drug/metabolite transporter (DMT)-like permease
MDPAPFLGESAALATAACWALTALAFESAGRRVGSLPVNLIRLVVGFALLVPLAWVRRGLPFPVDAAPSAWLWLGVSGLIGFAFGDLCLFRAFVLVGSRVAVLLMSLVPPMTALIGGAVLDESLTAREWTGMAITVAGIAWVVRERRPDAVEGGGPLPVRGILLGVGGALGQAVGLVLSKLGMGDYDAFAANQIRVLAGIAGFAAIFTAGGLWSRLPAALRNPQAMRRTAFGGVFGPFLGVSLSLVAVQHTEAGVAATLMALTPVLILPLAAVLRRERVSVRAAAGALVAVAGTAVLVS